ncbi:MAG: hypothetical protein KJ050_14170 [Candidatus Omnitrophica bacterium]|nr:hypothetical protein [bacterium]MBV6480986.1 hypothetical protein [bacterium]MCE7907736.1 hypothetical protein [Candidatus Omnitrophica bacterium COP1]MCL4736075.1 hypothetical protein [Candidatus Omnitrophota bacterium]
MSRVLPILIFLLVSAIQAEEMLPAAVHDALAGALVENHTRVSSIREVIQGDSEDHPDRYNALLDDLAVLEILSTTRTTEEKGKALKAYASKMNDPVSRERLLNLSSRVNDVELNDLIRKRKINKVTGFFNRAWQTTSEVMTGQPRALAVAGTDAFFAVTGKSEPQAVDKKIAYLARLREAGGDASPEELEQGRQIISSLEQKKSRTLLKSWKESIKESERLGETGRVSRLCRIGTNLWPEEQQWFSDHAPAEGKPDAPTGEVAAEAQAIDDPSVMILRRKLVESEKESKEISVDPAREPIENAYAVRRSKTFNYLLFGETGIGLNSHGVARSVAQHGADAPAAIGLIQGAQTVLRSVTLLFGNQLGIEQAIESYAEVNRKTPEALTKKDYQEWADLCCKAGRFKEALDILKDHQISDPGREHKYRSKWGSAILKRCEDLPAGADRFNALKFILENLADTSAASKAQQLLLETPSSEKALVQVKKVDLVEFEPLLHQAGLRFQKEWWDGQEENGEINDEGIFWDTEGIVWFRVGKKSGWRNIRQDPEHLQALNGAFTRIEDESLARHLLEKRRGKRKFPVEVEGALGPDSTYMTPKIVQYEVNEDEEGLFQ